jgi:uncharacterized protein YicC (UPF0701 family)
MKSMTGYGEAEAQGRWAKIAVQLRTLNHRHLDIQLRVPREYLSIEEEIRKILRQSISRGRVELFINRSPLRDKGRTLELDEGLLEQYLKSLRRAEKKFGLKGEANLSLLSSLPGLFQIREEQGREEDEKRLVLQALRSALKRLERAREREGRQLQLDVEFQVRHLQGICTGLESEESKLPPPREDSLSQGDIHEEVVRFKTHVGELARLIRAREPIGKKIDFLLQEILRELNTVGSKVPNLSAVHLVLAGKEKVEKIREQAQNVE